MIKNFLDKKWIKISLFAIFAFLSGVLNGFIGTGGGILLVFAFSRILKLDKKDAFASSLCVTVPVSAVALFNYFKNGSIDLSLVGKLWFFVLLGGIFGSFLTDKLNTVWLNSIFAILVIYAGMCLILR